MDGKKRWTTMVVGSHTVPDWYPILQKAVENHELSPEAFQDAKETAARASIKDLEAAGVSVLGDGELLRRSNNICGPPNAMINFFSAKIKGFSAEIRPKTGVTPVAPDAQLPAPVVTSKLSESDLGLVGELKLVRECSPTAPVKIAITGPHMFVKVAWNDGAYPNDQELAFDMAKVLNAEILKLDAAGCDVIQLDEPILWFLTGDQEWGIEAINRCFAGVKRAKKALHLCQGNYQPDPSAHKGLRIFPSKFNDALPIIKGVNVDIIVLAFSSFDEKDISVLSEFPSDKILAVGVIDVQKHEIETPEEVVRTLTRIGEYLPKERIMAVPDCGLNHLPRNVAFKKLQVMVKGANTFFA